MDRKGSVAVEFALVLPVLVLLLFGIVEFGVLFYDKAVITNASREGARRASLHSPQADSAIINDVQNDCRARIISFESSSEVTATVSPPGPRASGVLVTITVNFTYNFLVLDSIAGLFPGDFSGGVDLGAATVMRTE